VPTEFSPAEQDFARQTAQYVNGFGERVQAWGEQGMLEQASRLGMTNGPCGTFSPNSPFHTRHRFPETSQEFDIEIVSCREPNPIPDTVHDRCPGCAEVIRAQLQLLAERIAGVAKLPRLMLVCDGCQRTFLIMPPLTQTGVG
jgi:hypothetical protein